MYANFQKIDGTHPWRNVSPEGYEDYPVRYRKDGRVIYFNYALAKEMGLIAANHPKELNSELDDAILKAFSLQILNEHDWATKKTFPKDGYEDRLYMATRYLQSQHENKRGMTSGDGRSIWNGHIQTKNMVYDISSRGTGNTILSPGSQEAKGAVKTGDVQYGYSSGLADLDEMFGGAVLAEIFYKRGIPTERCLAVIEYDNSKSAIGVRVAPNLIRPAHIFRYLKLGQWEETKASFDYFLRRQEANGVVKFSKEEGTRYCEALHYLSQTYARLAAVMEEEYIFNWLAWDGDNVLADGAILDYGSIRQFAAKHNKYRYEDVDRYSSSLTEQKYWARVIVQTFAQSIDFILTKEKKNFKVFEGHSALTDFDRCFKTERQKRMLARMGFTDDHINGLITSHEEKIEAFRKVLNYFEDVKTVGGEIKLPDGIDHPPVFLIRHVLRELPDFLFKNFKNGQWALMPVGDFCQVMAATYAEKEDLVLTDARKLRGLEFQELYRNLVVAVAPGKEQDTLKTILQRASVINYEYRSTGDGLTWVVNEAIKIKDDVGQQRLQDAVDRFIDAQVLVPGKWKPIKKEELKGNSKTAQLLRMMQENLELYKEKI